MTTSLDPYQDARAEHRRKTLTIPLAARELGISPSTAYERVRQGTFPVPVHRDGGHRYVITADMDRYLGTLAPAAPARLAVVPSVASPLLEALSYVNAQIAYLHWQKAQIEQQIAAERADAERIV
ncbi:MAG: helix-turn-helix domain-containing protein [Chloroflexota bacterium]|nr:helix-turn-helix domain-containing protein [Chloroflexota bacterium]